MEYAVKRIRDDEEFLRSLYDPQKGYDDKVRQLTWLADGGQIDATKEQIIKEKARTGSQGPFGQTLDNTSWIKKLEEFVLPNAIEAQATAVETLKTISIIEFENEYAKKMTAWQKTLDRAIQELEVA